MNPKFLLALLLAAPLLYHPLVSRAQTTTPQTTTPALTLPLGRTHYFIGETIPFALAPDSAVARFELVDANGRVAASYRVSERVFRIEKACLAEGIYQVRLDGILSGVFIGIHSALRESSAALVDESLPNAPREAVAPMLKETGINAVISLQGGESGRYAMQDEFAPTGTMLFFNPYTRPMSFFGARVYQPELQTFRHRLVLMAQANAERLDVGCRTARRAAPQAAGIETVAADDAARQLFALRLEASRPSTKGATAHDRHELVAGRLGPPTPLAPGDGLLEVGKTSPAQEPGLRPSAPHLLNLKRIP